MKKRQIFVIAVSAVVSISASLFYLNWRLEAGWKSTFEKELNSNYGELFLKEKALVRKLLLDSLQELQKAGKLVQNFNGAPPEQGAAAVDPLAGFFNKRKYFHLVALKQNNEDRFYFRMENSANSVSSEEVDELTAELLEFNNKMNSLAENQPAYLLGSLNLKSKRSVIIHAIRLPREETVFGVFDPTALFSFLKKATLSNKFSSLVLSSDCQAVYHPLAVRTGKSYEGTRFCALLKDKNLKYRTGIFQNFEGKKKLAGFGQLDIQEDGERWYLVMESEPMSGLMESKDGVSLSGFKNELFYAGAIFLAIFLLLFLGGSSILARKSDSKESLENDDFLNDYSAPRKPKAKFSAETLSLLKDEKELSEINHPVELLSKWNSILKKIGFEGEMVFLRNRSDKKKNFELVYGSDSLKEEISDTEFEIPVIASRENVEIFSEVLKELMGIEGSYYVSPVFANSVIASGRFLGVVVLISKDTVSKSIENDCELISSNFGSRFSSLIYSKSIASIQSQRDLS